MQTEGLEPTRPKSQPPQGCAATNYATSAELLVFLLTLNLEHCTVQLFTADAEQLLPLVRWRCAARAAQAAGTDSEAGVFRVEAFVVNHGVSPGYLKYTHDVLLIVVEALGLEPRTTELKVRCSNQLSYTSVVWSELRGSNPSHRLGRPRHSHYTKLALYGSGSRIRILRHAGSKPAALPD